MEDSRRVKRTHDEVVRRRERAVRDEAAQAEVGERLEGEALDVRHDLVHAVDVVQQRAATGSILF